MHSLRALAAPVAVLAIAACVSSDASTGFEPVRETLANGAVSLSYPALPAPVSEPVQPSLRIGVVDGDPTEIFGDIRAVEADADGNIYVLDHQASEIRAFDADGRYLRTLTRSGEGPGELRAANGMLLTDRGTLWVQDHGQWRMIELTLEGEEIRTVPMHVLSYGYVWNGMVDDRGRFWKPVAHSDAQRTYPPETGLQEGRSRSFLKSFDPRTEQTDSVFLGVRSHRRFVSTTSRGGWAYHGIPFDSRTSLVVDPAGGSWVTSGETYRVARLNDRGDTVLVVEADVPPEPVTEEDRRAYVESSVESAQDRGTAEELAKLAPATKPVIDQLTLDSEGRLWVRRTMEKDETPTYDVFDREGGYAGSVRLGFRPLHSIPPRIKDGRLYAAVSDELGVPTVVRAEIPPLDGGADPRR